jgi:diguanylate cyclase (GGDEF)-like protein
MTTFFGRLVTFMSRDLQDLIAAALPSLSFSPPSAGQFESVMRATPAAMVGHLINTTIAVIAFHSSIGVYELALWAMLSAGGALYVLVRRMSGAFRTSIGVLSPERVRRLEHRAILNAALLGLPWGYLAVRYMGGFPHTPEIILIALGVGMAASGAILLAPLERAAVTYCSVILLPSALTSFSLADDTGQYALLGCLSLSFWMFLLALIGTANRLIRSKSEAVEKLTAALSETHQAQARIEHIALHDSLTGLANRRAFLHKLNNVVLASQRTGCASWAVLLLDLDRFKVVNDTLGHKFGDELLRQVAERLRRCIRPGDLVARLGGDEFCIVAANVLHIGEAEAIAVRMLDELGQPFFVLERTVTVGVSIGIAAPLSSQTDSEQIMRCADLAMYDAKAAGRNGFKVFELEMQDRMEQRSLVEMGLRKAIKNNELTLYYQPVYELAGLKLARFEALIRWRHPDKGLLSPAAFLPVAEEIGLINEIGAWALNEACRQAMEWPSDIAVAVNLSPIQVSHAHVVQTVERALRDSGLPPARLELEITETALLSDTQQTKQRLEQLNALGLSLSMDDFGTGYSSLNYLATFPLAGIKIDKSFIARFALRNENAEIMRAMLDLAKTLNRSSTVEGIETFAQLSAAQALGATYGQGYYFSPPLPAADAARLIGPPKILRAS